MDSASLVALVGDNARQQASYVSGWLSIGCWLIVYSPQIWENYVNQSGEGLSLLFVITWLLGDIFNLVGAIMAGLLPTVIILAVYYTLCDITLWVQIYYYRWFNNAAERSAEQIAQQNETTPLLLDGQSKGVEKRKSSLVLRAAIKYTVLWLFVICFGIGAYFYDRKRVPHDIDPEQPGGDLYEWKSQLLGWLSAVLYLGSRIPQITKNMQTKCEGLAPALFMFAIGGNVFYVLSICIASMDKYHLKVNASWLAGSGLTVILDVVVLGQCAYYNWQKTRIPPPPSDQDT